MRIIQVLNTHHWSAAANYCITISKELIRRGHDLLLLTEPGKALERAKEAGIKYDDSIRLNHRNPLLFVDAIKRMKQIFHSFKPDIISPHMNEAAWLPGMISRKAFPQAIIARIRTEYDPPKKHFINRYVHHAWTDHLVVGSMLHKLQCQEILDYQADKISVVYGGVDTEMFNPGLRRTSQFRREIGANEHEVLIGLLARLDPVKGHEFALEAIARIKNLPARFRLVLVGYEAERTYEWIKSLAAELGVSEKIVCAGYRDDLADVLGALDIGLISSVGSEANSRAALEFMACGKPVIASAVGVIPEIIQNQEQGLVVSPRDAEQLGNAIEKLIVNPVLRHNMGKSSRQKVLDNFSLEKFGSVMENVYAKLLRTP
ncbi:MAG: glycosyltransferase family 4 protein [Candidatus Riflebacteria bacterium]|nr:glycosyltransferase family 4 protein [Candidatus Riflebacteria bacterium]